MRLSVSQMKKYMKSKAEWAGQYILGIYDNTQHTALIEGSVFHKWVEA